MMAGLNRAMPLWLWRPLPVTTVSSLSHGFPLISAITRQQTRLWHTSFHGLATSDVKEKISRWPSCHLNNSQQHQNTDGSSNSHLYQFLPEPNCHQHNLRPHRHNFSLSTKTHDWNCTQLWFVPQLFVCWWWRNTTTRPPSLDKEGGLGLKFLVGVPEGGLNYYYDDDYYFVWLVFQHSPYAQVIKSQTFFEGVGQHNVWQLCITDVALCVVSVDNTCRVTAVFSANLPASRFDNIVRKTWTASKLLSPWRSRRDLSLSRTASLINNTR